MSSSARAIVVGHADIATGMVGAVEQISGRGDLFLAISSAGHGAAGIEELIRKAMAETGVRLIFTDLPGGSATMAARRVQRAFPEVTVVAGTNLGVLLEFAQQDDGRDESAAVSALEKGRAAMIVFGASVKRVG